jgi:hypothetical protein
MNRGRHSRLTTSGIIATAALAVAFGLGSPAHAEDWKPAGQFGFFGVGKAYQVEKGHLYWIGEYSGTFFNDKGKGSLFDQAGVKCPAFADIDNNNKKVKGGGYCIISDLAGDQAYLSWQGEGDGISGHPNPGTFEWTGGTGKYQGITGKNTYTGFIQVNWQDGTSSGYSTWNR